MKQQRAEEEKRLREINDKLEEKQRQLEDSIKRSTILLEENERLQSKNKLKEREVEKLKQTQS